ncbi:DUF4167 domain-containing protein [Erythrobacter sp.]|uniref:DUF4167 domain-containing protein n=1 Tax=Erythrobacter sp. TaxID=1042 RepID=UPI002EA9E94E|nr:DUF4167 domain-containing protein [Erythrobacter sp.]
MNNNRNNRRRGRGNRNSGGPNNQNRIDSRARGNAPQLLDKYKKLAQDAQHNGDRVQAEYYLQFADHYFRVIADNKARQDEARSKRNDDRGQANDDSGDDDDGDTRDTRRKNNRRTRGRHDDDGYDGSDSGDTPDQGEAGVEGEVADAEEENAKPKRRARKPKAGSQAEGGDETPRRKPRTNGRTRKGRAADDSPAEIDSSVLPPSISLRADAGSDDDDSLEAVG